jgi:hypothetical protein
MYTSDIRDTNGRFLNSNVLEAVEYALACEEHEDMPSDLAREVALANGAGRKLTDKQVEKFDEVLGCY